MTTNSNNRNNHERPNLQTLRSSCDRCRSHKLKCTLPLSGPPGVPNQCIRCARAKTECIFSRRARGRRHDSNKLSHHHDWEVMPLVRAQMCPGDEFGDGIIPDLSQPTNLDKRVNTSGLGGGSDIRSSVNLDCTPQMTAWNNLLGDDQRKSRDLFNFTAANLFDSCHLSHPADDFGPDIALCPIPNLAREGQDEQETESSISYPEKDESPIVYLSNLMIDIHEAAKTLTDSPWAYPNHSTGLDSYPVGIVLQLPQDLFRILHRPISMTSTNHGSHSQGSATADTLQNRDHHLVPDLQSRTTNSSSISTPPHQPAGLITTPHILLVMSCYTSFTKLYVVMSHFRTHLRGSSERHSTQKLPFFDQNISERLRLGELALPRDMWIKTDTAMRALLDILHAVETAIGVPERLSIAGKGKNLQSSLDMEETMTLNTGFIENVIQVEADRESIKEVQLLKEILRKK